MNYRIRDYVEDLFQNAPRTHKVYDLKDELLLNLNEKYEDLVAAGKSKDEAFKIVIESIGDLNELLQGIGEVAITTNIKGEKKKTALIVSVSVCLYIIALAALVFIEEVLNVNNDIGVVIMLTIAAVPTGMLIYHFMSKENSEYSNRDKSLFREEKDIKSGKGKKESIYDSISSIVWLLTTAVYLWVSFVYGIWAYSWIIFVLVGVTQSVVSFGIKLSQGKYTNVIEVIESVLWPITGVIYLWVSFVYGIWAYSWIIFIIAAAVQNIIRLLFELKEK